VRLTRQVTDTTELCSVCPVCQRRHVQRPFVVGHFPQPLDLNAQPQVPALMLNDFSWYPLLVSCAGSPVECHGCYELHGPAELRVNGPSCTVATLGEGAWVRLCGAEHDGLTGSDRHGALLTQVCVCM
jgi:hypothetical protein